MAPAASKFWWHYHVCCVLLPAYSLALISYGLAALGCLLFRQQPVIAAAALGLHMIVLALGAGRWLGYMGFRLSGVPARLRAASEQELMRLASLQVPRLPLLPAVIAELGDVIYLACEAAPAARLLISSACLEQTADEQLACLLAHEQAHAAVPAGRPWDELGMLAAWPLSLLVLEVLQLPLFLPLLAALHVSLWLRWRFVLQARREALADRMAAAHCGRLVYAAALAASLARFEPDGDSSLRRMRLNGLGLSKDEVNGLIG